MKEKLFDIVELLFALLLFLAVLIVLFVFWIGIPAFMVYATYYFFGLSWTFLPVVFILMLYASHGKDSSNGTL
jgi:membrane protein implicated in regulation of membrane protease activity